MEISPTKVVLGIIAFILIAGWAGRQDYEDAKREELRYCADVYAYKHSNGTQGHPAYDGDEFCDKYTEAQPSMK